MTSSNLILSTIYFCCIWTTYHYAPEIFKMWSWGLTLLTFDNFTVPLQLYMKSWFGEFKRSENVIFGNFWDPEFWILANFGLESCSKLIFTIQNLKNCQKWHFRTVWIHQSLISRKIGVAVKCQALIHILKISGA